MDTIVWFDQTRVEDVPVVGGKAASLGELQAAGLPGLPGFTVPANVYSTFISDTGIDAVIAEILEGLDANDEADLTQRGQQIRDLFSTTPMPQYVIDDVAQAYEELTEDTDGSVAVRSSATAEDLPDDSFAGQQSTYLNVLGTESVVKAVKDCWGSLFEDRAIAYRVERGYDHMSVGLAAVVQVMVQSVVAGVMFTVNSTDGSPEIEISAGHGLGEAIVSGEVTGDAYFVSKESLDSDPETAEIRRIQGLQTEMLVRSDNPDNGELNVWVPVPEELNGIPVLTDAHIRELAVIGLRVERHYKKPMDIEWAIGPNGKVVLTQARPITVNKEQQIADEPLTEEEPAELLLTGIVGSTGVACGRVVVIDGSHQNDLVGEGDILVARKTDPNYLPAMRRAAAIVTEEGGRLSHAAIVARELGIAAVVGSPGARMILDGHNVVTVDGSHGDVFAGEAVTRLAWGQRRLERNAAHNAAMADVRTRTKVYAILADPDLAALEAAKGFDGVGLLRLEFVLQNTVGIHPAVFLARGTGEEFIQILVDAIGKFLEAFGPGRRVVLRLTDLKTNEYWDLEGSDQYEDKEENPMIGLRGAARYLQRPEEFALEVEAIRRLRQVYSNLTVMVPFVRTPEELTTVIGLLNQGGVEGDIWMMAEVPSNVILLEDFIACGIDGISIGSNDLTQLLFGIDRDNHKLDGVADERHPLLRMALKRLVQTARYYDRLIGICGQAPSDFPELAEELVELGVTSLSVSPDVYARTRQLVADIEKSKGIQLDDDSA